MSSLRPDVVAPRLLAMVGALAPLRGAAAVGLLELSRAWCASHATSVVPFAALHAVGRLLKLTPKVTSDLMAAAEEAGLCTRSPVGFDLNPSEAPAPVTPPEPSRPPTGPAARAKRYRDGKRDGAAKSDRDASRPSVTPPMTDTVTAVTPPSRALPSLSSAAQTEIFPENYLLPEEKDAREAGPVTPPVTPGVIKPTRRPKADPSTASPEVREVFEHWRSTLQPKAELIASRRQAIEAALRRGLSVADCKLAVDGCAKLTWHREHGHTDLTLVLREAKADWFMALGRGEIAPPSSGPANANRSSRTAHVQPADPGEWDLDSLPWHQTAVPGAAE